MGAYTSLVEIEAREKSKLNFENNITKIYRNHQKLNVLILNEATHRNLNQWVFDGIHYPIYKLTLKKQENPNKYHFIERMSVILLVET